ncbi:MAG: 3-methyladenine DNA glycosylase [Opitutales bacterium]|nr:3-methyladenine DNA glycosylase [Opitutales bacterium]|tara:strand:- start:344 stop:883 length:540 start_codon:yes stop_codon:yes gene_type:complete
MARGKSLFQDFFDRPTLEVAPDLLGKFLCREVDGSILRLRITEVEAYDGPEDKACHAHRGKTPRNEIMFGPAGRWYVYLCYGMHWMLNAVTGPVDFPAAVLFRGCLEVTGPGRLTKALGIDRNQDQAVVARASGLWVEDDGFVVPGDEIERLPRVGIGYAGEEWVNKPYRFVWETKRNS